MNYKIVHIITRLDKGGSTEDVLLTTTHFAQKGYQCSLIYGKTINPPVELVKKTKTAGVKFIGIESLVRSISPFRDLLAFLCLLRLLRLLRPDIVHTHSSKAGILGRLATYLYSKLQIADCKLKPKIVHTPHGHVFYGYYGRMITTMFITIERITAIITNKLIALTEGEKNESLAYGVGRSEQWEVIHSGVNFSDIRDQASGIRKEFDIPEEAIVIGSVGRLDPVKGYKYFVEAIPLITQSPITNHQALKFLIVGDGEERKNLQSVIVRRQSQALDDGVCNLKLEDRVIFTGWRNDVEEMISLMDIYVQPSINEGMGKTLIQAQALGKPIVATNVQGIPSVVKDGVTGILVPPKNSQALAEAILELAESEERRRKMGKEGKKWVTETVDGYARFSTERMLHLIEKLYAELLKA